MRKIITLLPVLLCSLTMAQPPEYTKVIVLSDSANADMLYSRARLFFANAYQSAKAVISFEDAASHTVVGTGYFDIPPHFGVSSVKAYQTIKIECKDNRYRYEITDRKVTMVIPTSAGTKTVTNPYDRYVAEIEKLNAKKRERMSEQWVAPMKDLINTLVSTMAGSSTATDW